MKIVDTSNGPAIDDDGYIILPTDRAGMLHLAALDPDAVNELMDSISRYVNEGLSTFKKKVRLNAAGEVNATAEEMEEVFHQIRMANSSTSLMVQISQHLLQGLAKSTDETTVEPEVPAPSFPTGYKIVVYPTVEGDGVPGPGLYYPDFEVVPQKILDLVQSGAYSLYQYTGPETGTVQMTYDEVMAELQP